MKRIVVATDGSEQARRAVERATELKAKNDDVLIELVYVTPPMLLPPNDYAEALAAAEQEQRVYAERILGDAAEAVEKEGASCETAHLNGPVAESIATFAEDQHAWMVIAGSCTRGPLGRMFLGSVADRLVHISKRPVLIVH